MNNKLFEYIFACPSAYHATAHTADILRGRGFTELSEGEAMHLEKNKSYFVTRNGSSLIAFRLPEDFDSFMMTAAHGDSPSFKVKENAAIATERFTRLSTERYGGMISSTWMDRPLSIAGRAVVMTEDGIESRLVDLKDPVAVIPNVAPHLDFKCEYDAKTDMLPLFSGDGDYADMIARAVGADKDEIISTDLFLYNPAPLTVVGDYVTAPRLDDLMCAFASLEAFLSAEASSAVQVFCLFDNEEVGSTTKQGAASTFLYDVLSGIAADFGKQLPVMLASSMLLSCDNAHAVHPNHPELADKNHSVYMNGGVVIKYNANQKYTSDGISAGLFKAMMKKAGLPYQEYANRADMRGGSTLGNILNTQVSLNTVDIGIAQLAMHSCLETAGAQDTQKMVDALTVFFESKVKMLSDGIYDIR